MRKIKRQRQRQGRGLVLALCLCMLASVFPLASMTYAAGTGCNHTHDKACGYIEAAEGQPCTFAHEHDDSCGYAEGADAAPCSAEAAHVHDAAVCGYKEAVPGAPCTHSHDESCGGPQAKAGGQDIAAAAPMSASQRDAGYVLNNGKLTVTTNEGTTAWREAHNPSSVLSLEIGDQVTAIGDNAFLWCSLSLSPTITLPAGLKSIGDSAFRDSGLVKVDIPAGVEHIGGGAFFRDNMNTISVDPGNQHFVSVGNALYSKDMGTLYHYPRKEAGADLTILDSVEHIEDWVFYNYTSLESVKFPAGLKSIGDYAFSICNKLESVDLSGCAGLISIGDFAFESCLLTSVKLPAGLKSIGERAFGGGLFQSVDISASVEHIGEGAFFSIELASINLDPGNRHFIIRDNVLYNTAQDTLHCYPAKKTDAALTIPDSVERIGDDAFNGCNSLTSVELPAGLKRMGEGAFGDNNVLRSVDLSRCADLESIEEMAFQRCGKLESVDLSGCAGLESIGDEAFQHCNSLTSVTFPAGLERIGRNVFYGCSKMTTIRFMGDVPSIIGSFGASNLKEIYYPAGAQGYTDNYIFKGMTFIEIYRLTVERGVDETGGSPYDPGDRVTIAADTGPGKTFVGWRGGDDSVFAVGSREDIRTTIIMPAEHLTLTVAYAEDEIKHSHSYGDWQHDDTHHWRVCSCGDITDKDVHDLGDWITDKKPTDTDAGSRHRDCNTCGYRQTEGIAPTGPDYEYRTLSDNASGVKVSGYFTDSGLLEVKEILLHLQGDCDVCDDIRQRQEKGEVIVLFDIGLKSGKYTGELDVEIPVGEQYNGQTVLMLHCKDKVLESRTVTVENGVVRGTFSSLSPYAVARVPSKTVITGLPESHTLLVGETVSWTPAPAGGQWSYDRELLEMTQGKVNDGEAGREGPLGGGDSYTFKALKEGKATATYTMNGVPHTVTITINSSTIPQTVDAVNSGGSPQTRDVSKLWLWTLLMLVSLLGWGGLLIYAKRSKKA